MTWLEQQDIIRGWREPPALTADHLNLRWTVEDMDAIKASLRSGSTIGSIAKSYSVADAEMLALCERNGLIRS